MSKSFLFKILTTGSIVVAVILWILSLTTDYLKELPFSFSSLIILIISGVWGLSFVGLSFSKSSPIPAKHFYLWVGIIFLAVGVLCVVNIFAINDNLYLPIICLVIAVGLLVSVFVTGGKKWDQGDNQKVGYKSYRERKAEEEKASK